MRAIQVIHTEFRSIGVQFRSMNIPYICIFIILYSHTHDQCNWLIQSHVMQLIMVPAQVEQMPISCAIKRIVGHPSGSTACDDGDDK